MARRWCACALLCLCILIPARAAEPGKTASKRPAKASRAAKPIEAMTPQEIAMTMKELKSLIDQQRREIEAQRAELREQSERVAKLERSVPQIVEAERKLEAHIAAPEPAQPVAAAEPPPIEEEVKLLEGQLDAVAENQAALATRVTELQTASTAAAARAEGRLRQLGNFRFSGDLRYRYEPFLQAGQTTRQRQRIRARFNLQGNLTNEVLGGISIATGSLDDPISTNQTLSGFFNRKNVGFDRLFIQYTPKWGRNHVQMGAGKFAFPWIRTPLTFDNDMNPEGVYTRLNWDLKSEVFKGFTLVGFHLPFFERGGSTSASTGVRADGYDAFIAGGQLQTRWRLGERLNLGLHVAGLNFVNADLIAQAHSSAAASAALANNTTGNQPVTNCLRTNAAGATVGYCSRFLYLNTMLTLGVNTGRPRWPVNFTFDFNNNTRAQRIIQSNTASPTGRAENPERSAFWTEVQFGRLSEAKDVQFGYTFIRIERDAVIGAFTESDLRAGSNVSQHRLNFNYQWTSNVSLNYALWMGRLANAQDNIGLVPGGKRAQAGAPCNSAPFSGCTDNVLKRMQFDFIYRF